MFLITLKTQLFLIRYTKQKNNARWSKRRIYEFYDHLMWNRKQYFKGTKKINERKLTIFIKEGKSLLKTLKMEHFWLIQQHCQWSLLRKINKPDVSRPPSQLETTAERAKLSRQPADMLEESELLTETIKHLYNQQQTLKY